VVLRSKPESVRKQTGNENVIELSPISTFAKRPALGAAMIADGRAPSTLHSAECLSSRWIRIPSPAGVGGHTPNYATRPVS
jgi:hypothetical protein